jgi:hypothetical protein
VLSVANGKLFGWHLRMWQPDAKDRNEVALMELRLDRSSDPIEGRLSMVSRSGAESSWEFVGWLAFVRAVEAAIAADDPRV